MTKMYECFICENWHTEPDYLKHMIGHSSECELPGDLQLPAAMTPEVVNRWSMIGVLRVKDEDVAVVEVREIGLTMAM